MRSRVRSGGRESSTDALILYERGLDCGSVEAGGAWPVGLGSDNPASIVEVAVAAFRFCIWRNLERHERHRAVD